jgi:hypothetical protein
MDLAEAPPPPDEVESGGLAAMEVEEGPPPLEIEVLDEEEDIKGKKTGRTAKPRRKKT